MHAWRLVHLQVSDCVPLLVLGQAFELPHVAGVALVLLWLPFVALSLQASRK